MGISYTYFTGPICTALLVLCLSLIVGKASIAAENNVVGADDSSSHFELNATMMQVDQEDALMIIAEEAIHLPCTLKDGKKQWKTEFLDVNGHKTSIDLFQLRDRVLVEGSKTPSGYIEAHRITLLESFAASKERAVKQEADTVHVKSSSPLQMENGVWKN